MERLGLDRELAVLRNCLSEITTRVESIMSDTLKVIKSHDVEQALRIIKGDGTVNAEQTRIEQQCIRIISLQQPMASDLREVTSSLKMVTDVERIADQCADICEIIKTNPELSAHETPDIVIEMFEKAKEMFSIAADSFIRKDDKAAEKILPHENALDAMFSESIMQLTNRIIEKKKYAHIMTDYMFISKYCERLGDHATNIAEWTIYSATNVLEDIERKK